MKSVFYRGQKKDLITAVTNTVIKCQITVRSIIDITIVSGMLANRGFKPEEILREKFDSCQPLTVNGWIFNVERHVAVKQLSDLRVVVYFYPEDKAKNREVFALDIPVKVVHPIWGELNIDKLTDRELIFIGIGLDWFGRSHRA